MKTFYIGDILVSPQTPLVIPEIGINHNGDLTVAKAMAKAAYEAGARLIKHQTHVVEDEMSARAKTVIPGNADISIYDIMASCALNEAQEREFMAYVEDLGMVFISTPFSRAAADRLESFGVQAYKIGSGEMNNYPLLDHVASFGKPMIVSTGMNDLVSIQKAATIMDKRGVPYAFMHTTNLYPTQPSQIRLGAMQAMMEAFPDTPIGLSDHSVNNNACTAAITLGASVVERHFTDVKTRRGPDIVCSMDKQELHDLLIAARDIPLMRGGEKKPLPEEQVTIDFAFATVVTIRPIKKGEKLTRDNLWVKRPGTGEIHAEYYESLLGKTVNQDLDTDEHLTWAMVD